MEIIKRKKVQRILPALIFLILMLLLMPIVKTEAAEATAISFGTINYEMLTMQVNNNGNDIVYYSTDNNSWDELEGAYSSASQSYTMDISWVEVNKDVTLYFKGDKCKTIKSITLPMQNNAISVNYDKIEGEFTFSDIDDSDSFEWRKASDYNWTRVSLNETSQSYREFMATMESLRFKGAKIMIRTPQVIGTGSGKVGARPSSEITVTIPARIEAPSLKVNTSKLTINTTTAMEYYDEANNLWMECEGSMSLYDIAPKVLYENGGKTVTLQIRKAATTSSPCSNTAKLTIPGQTAPPTLGGYNCDVSYYYYNSKLVLQFNQASSSNPYEYAIVKANTSFSPKTASWKTVTASNSITLSASNAPKGCKIYVRKKGIDENTSNNVSMVLPSAVNSFTVNY
jgi:hypothetical protein